MDVDIIIVGSGPAGLSAARTFNGSCRKVVVIERLSEVQFSRYHSVCGEAVSRRMLSEAGIEPEGVVAEVDGIEISFPGEASVRIPVEGVVVDRPVMLRALRDSCDAEFVRATVRSVGRQGCRYVLDTTAGEFSCRHLIGADGAHSVVRRDVFGTMPADSLPIINNIVAGESDGTLRFEVAGRYAGGYSWRFPSKPGTVSVGYPKGAGSAEGVISRGARDLPFGGVPSAVSERALLVGDAAGLANPLCFGGIGIALVSGRRAAEAVLSKKQDAYGRWASGGPHANRHYMDAHRQFSEWTDDDIAEAMGCFRKGYSVARGFLAMLRHPRWANVYFACWMGFRRGW